MISTSTLYAFFIVLVLGVQLFRFIMGLDFGIRMFALISINISRIGQGPSIVCSSLLIWRLSISAISVFYDYAYFNAVESCVSSHDLFLFYLHTRV